MANTATVKRTHRVADALHSAAIHLLRRIRQEDRHLGITPVRLSALSVLVFGGPMRLTDLARLEQVKPPTMTRIVDGLEAQGLIRRRTQSGDARAVRLEPTPRGERIMQQGRRRRVARLAGALGRLPDSDLAALERAAVLIEQIEQTL